MGQAKGDANAQPTKDDLATIEAFYTDLESRLADAPSPYANDRPLSPAAESLLDDVHALLSSSRTEGLATRVLTDALQVIASTVLGANTSHT